MNLKLMAGRLWGGLDEAVKSTGLSVVDRYYPWSRDFVFDLKRFFPSGVDCIVDAGANVGSVSKAFSKWFPHAAIYAFEPIAATFQVLRQKANDFPNIHPIQLALGEREYQVEISLNREDTINSISAPPSEGHSAGKETISVTTLDAYAAAQGLPQPDILKIDVEGYEFQVLAGATRALSNQLKAIVLEVGYERGPSKVHFSEVEALMEKNDFQCCGVYDLSKSRDKRKLYYSNNLYIRKSLI